MPKPALVTGISNGAEMSYRPGCDLADIDVVLYTIEGEGHSWPGSTMPASITMKEISATDVLWQFFATHPKP